MELTAIGRPRRGARLCGDYLAYGSEQDSKKNAVHPHLKRQWCLGEIDSTFLWKMEHVLDVYARPFDRRHPVICFDERPCQLIDDIVAPVPPKPGKYERYSYEYRRNGTAVVLLATEPLSGKRLVDVRRRRTKSDYTDFMKNLANEYPEAEKVVLIQDNLNTHSPSSFYENLEPDQAFDLTSHFEMIYTPKKASWLNMAEIEFSALSKQCLDRRIGSLDRLEKEVGTWAKARNEQKVKIAWQFTKDAARDKFQRHYRNAHS